MKGHAATATDKEFREAQAKNYKAANWALVLKMTARGGGKARMVKRGK